MRASKQRGMTMMELMMAIVIATIGLFGALAMMSLLFRNSTYTKNLSEAMSLVQSKLEIEVSRPVTSACAAVPTETSPMDALGRTVNATNIYPYTRTTTVTADGVRCKINVQVTFTDNYGNAHSVYAERERNTP